MQIHFHINISRPRWTRNWSLRRKVLVFLALALVLPPVAFIAASDTFSDVPDDHIFHDNISAIYGARITTGTTATTFSPEDLPTRGQIAALLHRGLPRLTRNPIMGEVTLTNEEQDVAVVPIKTGGVAGGIGFVKLDASLHAFTISTTGCPCRVQYVIEDNNGSQSLRGFFDIQNVSAMGGNVNSGSLTWVYTVPTASTLTYRLKVIVPTGQGTGPVIAEGALTALYVPFGGGGDTALFNTIQDVQSPQGPEIDRKSDIK